MKYLKYALIAIVVLIIGYLLVGIIWPKIDYSAQITVDKPKEEVWAVLQDEDKLGEWLDGFQKVEHVSGTPGTVGAVSDVYFKNAGEEMVIRETITDIDPLQSISMSYDTEFMTMDYQMKLTPEGNSTKINSNTIVKGKSVGFKSMVPLMKSTFVLQEETNLGRLKETIENNTKTY